MKQRKLNLANIQGKLSRAEMKKIMAGSGFGCADTFTSCDTGNYCMTSSGWKGTCTTGWGSPNPPPGSTEPCYCI